ncbi:hypothetical protein SERLA73DRAFT_77990 [Serpula lacrymans var. lacrymans S7.3]|uniref:Uncharacterized protein n=2 Tax=Serpula lacrymans var. lacrymans TaxID=341189 RepID=F8QBT5_SERL3|nr:uncharacterized protein SERLADRAFT_442894 [Serpula lacrymans var. lacrymans S7.9]EGN94054.1 hypothetical protein SERLA73DRAFT_77990 [Serpula lacrymans var. lacrymans S7.3]EGO19407.1 hypothetical protein SERLADRAFT_442894 [Serpula lacrymans var. lacrymans S7.9]
MSTNIINELAALTIREDTMVLDIGIDKFNEECSTYAITFTPTMPGPVNIVFRFQKAPMKAAHAFPDDSNSKEDSEMSKLSKKHAAGNSTKSIKRKEGNTTHSHPVGSVTAKPVKNNLAIYDKLLSNYK